jgi:hypothetical protein
VRCDDGTYRNNRQVKESLERGEKWYSSAGEDRIPINWVRWCPGMNCRLGPYLVSTGQFQEHAGTGLKLKMRPRAADALENLPVEAVMPAPAQFEGVAATNSAY